jgi:GMC oxidoreductase
VAAATAAGLPASDDFNAATQDGVGCYQLTQQQGRRWSAADGYLRPAMGRANLPCFLVWRTPTTHNLWEEATPENLALWRRERRGPMASGGLEAGGFARSHDDRAGDAAAPRRSQMPH